MKGFFNQARATYQWRMDATVNQSADLDLKLKELERQENLLMNKLQNTQKVATGEIQRLRSVR